MNGYKVYKSALFFYRVIDTDKLTIQIPNKYKVGMQTMNNFKAVDSLWCCSQSLQNYEEK